MHRALPKVAVIELDPKYSGPQSAKVLRLTEGGAYQPVFEGPITPSTPWLRYVYSKFDFTAVNDPGLYVIEYAGQRTAPFPSPRMRTRTFGRTASIIILRNRWITFRCACLSQLWMAPPTPDDGRMAPVVGEQFDNWNQAVARDGKYQGGGDHIPGMNVGGWYDAGDFDLEEPAQLSVIQNLALAYREFNLKYDELTVDEVAHEVEMHRPDGVPDTVQQVKHGALLILAQFHNIGHSIRGTHEPDSRQYTHLGDGASKTDGRIYDPKLGTNEVKGVFSAGRMTAGFSRRRPTRYSNGNAIAARWLRRPMRLGVVGRRGGERLPRDRDWGLNSEKEHPTPQPAGTGWNEGAPGAAGKRRAGGVAGCNGQRSRNGSNGPGRSAGRGNATVGQDWAAALELTIATHGADPYKSRLKELFPQMITPQQMGIRGWMAVRALPYLDANAKTEMREAVKAYLLGLDKQLDATPFGVPPSLGTWGGSGAVVDMAIRMCLRTQGVSGHRVGIHSCRQLVAGTHPVSSTSYVAGVGTVSKTKTYSNNRADNAYIPGALIPGYIIKPISRVHR